MKKIDTAKEARIFRQECMDKGGCMNINCDRRRRGAISVSCAPSTTSDYEGPAIHCDWFNDKLPEGD